MIALALEFSSNRRSVALGRDGALLAEVVYEGTVRTPVFALIADALKQAGVTRDQVERLVVGLGPGSYTGVRIAISAVQGWQLAAGAETVGINSLDNLARAVTQPTLLVVDAQRGEFATALAAGGRLIEPVRLRPLVELQQHIAAGETVCGPDLERSMPGARLLYPTAGTALELAWSSPAVPAETLTPIYLREASFVKAPAARVIPGFTA